MNSSPAKTIRKERDPNRKCPYNVNIPTIRRMFLVRALVLLAIRLIKLDRVETHTVHNVRGFIPHSPDPSVAKASGQAEEVNDQTGWCSLCF